jgi:hypothetical protein
MVAGLLDVPVQEFALVSCFRGVAVYPILPSEILMDGWELICCSFTCVAAFLSYLFMMR